MVKMWPHWVYKVSIYKLIILAIKYTINVKVSDKISSINGK